MVISLKLLVVHLTSLECLGTFQVVEEHVLYLESSHFIYFFKFWRIYFRIHWKKIGRVCEHEEMISWTAGFSFYMYSLMWYTLVEEF